MLMKLRFCRPCLLASMVSLGVVLIGDGSVEAAKTLRWKFKQGDKFRVEMNQKQTMQGGTVSQNMVMTMSWHVAQVGSDGTIRLEQTVDRITMTMQIPGQGELKFDSASEEEPEGIAKMIGGMLKPLVGAKMTQTMNDRGQILGFEIAKEALEGVTAANPMMKELLSEDSLKQMTTQGSIVLPEQAIEKGHTWTSAMEVKGPMGKMKMDTTYVYEGEEERAGRVLDKFAMKIATSFGEGASVMGVQIKVTDQDSSGTVYFDAEAGRLAETLMRQKMTMQVADQQVDVDQTIRMNVTPVK